MLKLKQGDKILTLPEHRNEPFTDLSYYSILFYGMEKIGKTAMCAHFPDALFLHFEPGGNALRIFSRTMHDWKEFKGYLKLLAQTKRFKTIIIDTVDIAYAMCYRFICDREGIAHPKEEGFAIAWTMIKDEFSEVMSELLKLDRGVVFLSHATEREIKIRTGVTTHRIVPTMPKQARSVLEPMVDIWAYLRYTKDGSRQIMMRGNDHIAAGHRLQENFVGVSKINMGDSAMQAYKNFVHAFNKKTAEPSSPQKIKIKIKK